MTEKENNKNGKRDKKGYYETPFGSFPSVTTILGAVINKPFLVPWALKEGRIATIDAIWGMMQSGELHAASKQELEALVVDCMKEADRKKRQALDTGTLVHNYIETYHKEYEGKTNEFMEFVRAADRPDTVTLLAMLETYFRALEENSIKVRLSESVVYHSAGYAGTLDTISSVGERLMVGDIKTSSRCSYDMLLQTEAYRRAYCEMTGENVTGRYILRLDKANPQNYELKVIDSSSNNNDWDCFLSSLKLFNSMAQFDKPLGKPDRSSRVTPKASQPGSSIQEENSPYIYAKCLKIFPGNILRKNYTPNRGA